MAAFSTNADSQVFSAVSLIRKSSTVVEESVVSLQDQASSRFAELQKLLTGDIGESIISQINYKQLQQKILTLISQVLSNSRTSSLTFEDKLIVENALSLWVGCLLHNNSLLNDFYAFNAEDFILQGLLFCNSEKVREEFKQSLSSLSKGLGRAESTQVTPLNFLLKLLTGKFHLISQYHCKQYFDLFCELIDHHFNLLALSGLKDASDQVFDPIELLSSIIDKIKEYNDLSNNANALTAQGEEEQNKGDKQVSEQEEIYIGLLQLTGKIIDNFDISLTEKIVEQKNLIDEIFSKFLFASVFKQSDTAAQQQKEVRIKPRSRKDDGKKSGGYGKKSKEAAYKMLISLVRKSPLLMNHFLTKNMTPFL